MKKIYYIISALIIAVSVFILYVGELSTYSSDEIITGNEKGRIFAQSLIFIVFLLIFLRIWKWLIVCALKLIVYPIMKWLYYPTWEGFIPKSCQVSNKGKSVLCYCILVLFISIHQAVNMYRGLESKAFSKVEEGFALQNASDQPLNYF